MLRELSCEVVRSIARTRNADNRVAAIAGKKLSGAGGHARNRSASFSGGVYPARQVIYSDSRGNRAFRDRSVYAIDQDVCHSHPYSCESRYSARKSCFPKELRVMSRCGLPNERHRRFLRELRFDCTVCDKTAALCRAPVPIRIRQLSVYCCAGYGAVTPRRSP